MNEMRMLRDHRDAQPGPTSETIARARARCTDQTRRTARARRPMPSRRWGYALAAAGFAAAAVVAPAVLSDNTESAYAAERLPNGTIKVTLREFTDSAGLQRRLDELGVHAIVSYLPYGMVCKEGRTTDDGLANPQPEVVEDEFTHATTPATSTNTFFVRADRIKPGQTLVWEMMYDHDTQGDLRGRTIGLNTYLARGSVKPCKPVDWESGRSRSTS